MPDRIIILGGNGFTFREIAVDLKLNGSTVIYVARIGKMLTGFVLADVSNSRICFRIFK